MVVETPLNAHLNAQLDLQPLAIRERWMARAIVESLDDDGYLRTPLAELCELCELAPPVQLSEMQAALQRVQALDPAGVAATSVADCLRLQLPAIECNQLRALAARIVAQHLPLLAARDVQALSRVLGVPAVRVQQVCDRIRHFDPRPGWRFSSTRIAYVVPDVVVKKVRGEWRVQLNPAVIPRVRLNQVYAELFKRHRSPTHADMAGQLQEARWTVKNVEQRFSTILDVAEAIVKRQRHFLEFGPMAMKPLGLKEIADELGVHESTVSRVTNNKFIATPSGVFELKHFFSRVMLTANGSACSGKAIRGLLQDLIAAEAPQAPLSDAEITRQLAQQGLVVARRTVTKYRQSLRIDAVGRRRRQA
jgi:RNA polymerase sigma-54 factor